jgi:hypothetical protein
MRALIIGPEETAALDALRLAAASAPVDMPGLMKRLETPYGKEKHMRQMTAQTVYIPMGYAATLSIETGHRCGRCRHLSVSVDDPKMAPSPEAVWMIAEALGFTGTLKGCEAVWLEDLLGHGKAVNVLQAETVGRA